jgi:N-dimethylarginine dimethylaminohydrolase
MCTPVGYAINYEINPWMTNQIGHVSPMLAAAQWQALFDNLSMLAEIRLMQGDRAWPDLVFTANAGLPLPWSRKFILSNFRFPERQGEKAINRAWFEAQGWDCIELPNGAVFEGAGDALFDASGRLWVGNGPRSDDATPGYLGRYIDGPIHRLGLVDPNFYHLDTCFCPLPGGWALYAPDAFDPPSQSLLAREYGDQLIALTSGEAHQFCANAVCVGQKILMDAGTPRLSKLLGALGFSIVETSLSEFKKSGGTAKCLTLSLNGWVYESFVGASGQGAPIRETHDPHSVALQRGPQ